MTPEELIELTAKQKDRELDLREREVAAKEKESDKSAWTNPLVIGLFAATVGLIGNIFVARENNDNTKAVERVHAQSALILESVKTDKKSACDNLRFFVNLGFLDDSTKTITQGCPNTENPIPSLQSQLSQLHTQMRYFKVLVLGKNGEPVKGARVMAETDLAANDQTTDENGRCSFELISESPPVFLDVRVEGYHKFQIVARAEGEVRIELEPIK